MSGNISFLKERWLVVQFLADKRTAALFFFIVSCLIKYYTI